MTAPACLPHRCRPPYLDVYSKPRSERKRPPLRSRLITQFISRLQWSLIIHRTSNGISRRTWRQSLALGMEHCETPLSFLFRTNLLCSYTEDLKFEPNATIDMGHAKTARRVAWSPSGGTLATASFDTTVGLLKMDQEGGGGR